MRGVFDYQDIRTRWYNAEMKILSWNVNGLRSLEKSGDWQRLLALGVDIICLQETKSEEEQLSDIVRKPEGYYSFFSSSRTRKGWSGTALYSKQEPRTVAFGIGTHRFDQEGRLIIAKYKDFTLFNVYFPNGGQGPERLEFKLEFYDAFLAYIKKLHKRGEPIIFCGDVNTAHEEMDLARPHENEHRTGFLPEERAWIDEVVNQGYLDVFREIYPLKKDVYTYWDMKSHARERNVGWRLDYFFVSRDLQKKIRGFSTLEEMMGSDHCPIVLELKK